MKLWNRHTIPKGMASTYIGRGTPWGNPFKVGEGYSQGEAADAYIKDLAFKLARKDTVATKLVHDLAGIDNIVCSCAPKKCHGDGFVEIWNNIREVSSIPKGIRSFVKTHAYPYSLEGDGETHINVYTKGATKLGRALTNLSPMPVHIPEDGDFACMEGYWYYLSTGKKFEELKTMTGFDAKAFGLTKEKVEVDDFQDLIKRALKFRMDQARPALKRALKNTNVPLTHYYHYGTDESVLYTKYDWIVDYLMELRSLYQATWCKVVIAGSRRFTDYALVKQAIMDSRFPIHEVVSGTEPSGVDGLGERYAAEENIFTALFPADWEQYGKAAGFMRNADMAEYADKAIVICVNQSPGSMNMIREMKKRGKDVYEVHIQR